MAYARRSGASRYCDALSSFADQNVVGRRGGVGGDAEQGVKAGMPRAAPIEAEHEFIKVVLAVDFSAARDRPQAPALEGFEKQIRVVAVDRRLLSFRNRSYLVTIGTRDRQFAILQCLKCFLAEIVAHLRLAPLLDTREHPPQISQ